MVLVGLWAIRSVKDRFVLPAFKDLYGIDFETMTDEQARELNDRIFENDKNDQWLHHVITERANIELMLIDPYWARFKFERAYKFAVPILNVTSMVDGYHPSSFASSAPVVPVPHKSCIASVPWLTRAQSTSSALQLSCAIKATRFRTAIGIVPCRCASDMCPP